MPKNKNSILADSVMIEKQNISNDSINQNIEVEKKIKIKKTPSEAQLLHMQKMREIRDKKRKELNNPSYETKKKMLEDEKQRQKNKDLLIEQILTQYKDNKNDNVKIKNTDKNTDNVKIIKKPVEPEIKQDIENIYDSDEETNKQEKQEKQINPIRKLNRDNINYEKPKNNIVYNKIDNIKQIHNVDKKEYKNRYLELLGLSDN